MRCPRRALDTFCCPDGFRRYFHPPPLRWRKEASSRVSHPEKSVGKLGLVAFVICEVVIDTLLSSVTYKLLRTRVRRTEASRRCERSLESMELVQDEDLLTPMQNVHWYTVVQYQIREERLSNTIL